MAAFFRSHRYTKLSETNVQLATAVSEVRRLRARLESAETRAAHQMQFMSERVHDQPHQQSQQQSDGAPMAGGASNPLYNVANWRMLHSRVHSLTRENEQLGAQLSAAVETAEVLMATNQTYAVELDAAHQKMRALEGQSEAQQRRIVEQHQVRARVCVRAFSLSVCRLTRSVSVGVLHTLARFELVLIHLDESDFHCIVAPRCATVFRTKRTGASSCRR